MIRTTRIMTILLALFERSSRVTLKTSKAVSVHDCCCVPSVLTLKPEQRKATLRKVEIELDEADDIVSSPKDITDSLYNDLPDFPTRSGNTRDSPLHPPTILVAFKASKARRVLWADGEGNPLYFHFELGNLATRFKGRAKCIFGN